MLRAAARRSPTRWALVTQERRLTYAELRRGENSSGWAPRCSSSAWPPGDRALFQMGTVSETAIALFGCFKAGLVPVCTLPQHREIEMGELDSRSEATAYFVQSDFSAFDLSGFAVKLAAGVATVREIIITRGATPSRDPQPRGPHRIRQPGPGAFPTRRASTVGTEDVLTFQLSGGTTGVPQDHSAISRGVHGLGPGLGSPAST